MLEASLDFPHSHLVRALCLSPPHGIGGGVVGQCERQVICPPELIYSSPQKSLRLFEDPVNSDFDSGGPRKNPKIFCGALRLREAAARRKEVNRGKKETRLVNGAPELGRSERVARAIAEARI